MDIHHQIEKKLQKAFTPEHLDVINESHQHRVPKDAQTHFKAIVVSELFTDLTRLERHKKVYRVLLQELDGMIKALTLFTYTPQEWQARQGAVVSSPPCLGGGKKNNQHTRPQTTE